MASKPSSVPQDPGLAPWLLASVLVTVTPHFVHLSYWQILFVALVIAWRAWLLVGSRPLPARWLVTALTLAGIAGILIEYRRLFGQDSGVALLVSFMALKLLEARRPRDAQVLVMLGYFLLLTHYFYQDGIPTGAWMIVSLTVLTATLLRIETAALDTRNLLRRSAFLLAQSLPVMAVLFLLFPRIDGPLWGLPQPDRRNTTGLSEQMSPGSISSLTQSAEIAFRVQFDGTPPANDRLYWRGPVLEEFDGTTWRIDRQGRFRQVKPPVPTGQGLRYVVTLEPHQQRWLLALDVPSTAPREALLSDNYSLIRRRPVQERFRYETESVIDYLIDVDAHLSTRRRMTELPPGSSPRTRQLVAGWRAETASDEALIARALSLFRNEDFAYTLQPPLLGEQPVDEFLFRTRRGFCEHYASAFAVMLRSAGIPARIVTGYQGAALNPIDGFWVVRQADAHAWVEAWLPQRGWVRIDPTAAIAPSRIEQGIAAAAPQTETLPGIVRGGIDWIRAVRFRWEALNNSWNQWILGYDQARQLDLLGRMGLSTNWQSLIGILVVIAASAVLVLAAWAMRRQRPRDPLFKLWHRFNRLMAKRGLGRTPSEGPLAFGRRLAEGLSEQGGTARQFCELYARNRYCRENAQDLRTMSAMLLMLRRP